MRLVLALALATIASACVINAGAASRDQLTRRAAFDLDCTPNQLGYQKIDDRSYGVTGCGKRGTYVESCNSGQCTWVLNGSLDSDQPPPPPPPTTAPPDPPTAPIPGQPH